MLLEISIHKQTKVKRSYLSDPGLYMAHRLHLAKVNRRDNTKLKAMIIWFYYLVESNVTYYEEFAQNLLHVVGLPISCRFILGLCQCRRGFFFFFKKKFLWKHLFQGNNFDWSSKKNKSLFKYPFIFSVPICYHAWYFVHHFYINKKVSLSKSNSNCLILICIQPNL